MGSESTDAVVAFGSCVGSDPAASLSVAGTRALAGC